MPSLSLAGTDRTRPTGLAGKLITAALCIIGLFAVPQVVTNPYWLHVLNLVLIYTPLSIGANIITGYAGMVSMGQAAFFGLGAYTSALLMMDAGFPWFAAFLCAGLVAALGGALVAVPCLRVKSDFLSLVTIAFGQIFFVVINGWMDLTRGPMGIPSVPQIQVFGWKARTETDFWYVAAIIVGVIVFAAWRIVSGPVGRAWEMIRDDEEAARALGVNVTYRKILAFAVGCLFSGFAGSLFAHNLRLVSPDSFVQEESLVIMQMAILGGLASIPGSILGAFLLIAIPEALRSSIPELIVYRPGIMGLLLIVMMIWRPQGILGRRRAAPALLLSLSDTLRRALGLKPLGEK